MSTIRFRHSVSLVAALLWSLSALAAEPEQPVAAMPQHLGPATCASSVCHGRANASADAHVLQNEFRVWTREDAHSRAYNTLLGKRSKAIAARLGLAAAETAKVCLDCHADNVAEDLRGEKFQQSDGVGCEACHGGAGRWIRSHAERGARHADNLARGLVANENPAVRAALCLRCHLGNADRFAGHEMMAAGHPRLSFELTAFTANQPAHYRVDADYIERKGAVSVAANWAQGVVSAVQGQLDLLRSDRLHEDGWFPEPAMFDCHACHHPMNDRRWAPLPMLRGLPVGAIRLNDGNLQMLVALASVLSSERGQALEKSGNALHLASRHGASALRIEAGRLAQQVSGLQSDLAELTLLPGDLRRLRLNLLDRAGQGLFRDFVAAEQAFLAVETLSIELGDEDRLRSRLDRWFKTVQDEHQFEPPRFAEQATQLAGKLKN